MLMQLVASAALMLMQLVEELDFGTVVDHCLKLEMLAAPCACLEIECRAVFLPSQCPEDRP